jgi:hypothetical protein
MRLVEAQRHRMKGSSSDNANLPHRRRSSTFRCARMACHDRIEHGPHWDTIVKIEIRRHQHQHRTLPQGGGREFRSRRSRATKLRIPGALAFSAMDATASAVCR